MRSLKSTRVLVVEDEALIALDLQDTLSELGCEVVGVAARLDTAVTLAQRLAFDLAILDVNLGGKRADPVAEIIAARQLPMVFITGYGRVGVANAMSAPVVEKPCAPKDLERAMRQALRASHA